MDTSLSFLGTVCSEPMLSGENRPHFVFSSSNSIPGHTADKATFSSNRSWCGLGIAGDFLEIDFGEKYLISQLAILGDGSSGRRVTSYKFSYSEDNSEWFQGTIGTQKVCLFIDKQRNTHIMHAHKETRGESLRQKNRVQSNHKSRNAEKYLGHYRFWHKTNSQKKTKKTYELKMTMQWAQKESLFNFNLS